MCLISSWEQQLTSAHQFIRCPAVFLIKNLHQAIMKMFEWMDLTPVPTQLSSQADDLRWVGWKLKSLMLTNQTCLRLDSIIPHWDEDHHPRVTIMALALPLSPLRNLKSSPSPCLHFHPLWFSLPPDKSSGIVVPLISLLQKAKFEIKEEAAWALSYATSGMPLLEESLLRYIENDTFSWLRKNLKCVGNVLQQGMAESCYSCAITDAARAISIIKRVKGYPCNPSVQEMVDCLHHFAPPRPGIHIRIGGKGIPNTFPNACNYGKFVGYYSRSAYCYQGVVQDCREPLLVDGSHGPENQKIFLTGFGSKSRTITKKDKAEAIELLQAQPFVGRILVKENFKTWNPSVSHLYPGVSDAERKDYFEAKNKTRNLKYESRKKSVLEDILSKRGDGSSEKIVQVERVNEPVSRGILSHAILVVSHGTLQEVDENGSVSEIDYFTCKNSHGRSFGCCGFVKVPMDQVDLIYYPHEVVIEELSDGKKEEMKKAIQESRAAASKRDKDELEKILKELLVDGLITDDEVKSNS